MDNISFIKIRLSFAEKRSYFLANLVTCNNLTRDK